MEQPGGKSFGYTSSRKTRFVLRAVAEAARPKQVHGAAVTADLEQAAAEPRVAATVPLLVRVVAREQTQAAVGAEVLPPSGLRFQAAQPEARAVPVGRVTLRLFTRRTVFILLRELSRYSSASQ